MTIRYTGWRTAGRVDVDETTVARLIDDCRAKDARIAVLEKVRDAADTWLRAYADHPEDSEECRDAHRGLMVAVKGAG